MYLGEGQLAVRVGDCDRAMHVELRTRVERDGALLQILRTTRSSFVVLLIEL